jgi:hypothetical protein
VVVRRCQIWAVSRMGKNSPSHFCDCLMCVQASVRLGIVMKEKDIFHVSVRTLYGCIVAVCLKFSYHCLLHTCVYNFCHFELLVHCAHGADPSTTHS